MLLRALIASILTLGVLGPARATAQTPSPTPDGAEEIGTREPFFAPDGFWIRGGFGQFNANPDGQLPGQRGSGTFVLGFGSELTAPRFLSFEFEMVSMTRTFDTDGGSLGAILVVDDETSVASTAFSLGGRLSFPPRAPVRGYVTAGLGYVHTKFETGGSVFGIPGTAREQSDGGVRPVYGAGLQVIFGSWEVHADYRAFSLTGSFPEYELDSLDLGGSLIAVGVGWRPSFGRRPAADSSPPDRDR